MLKRTYITISNDHCFSTLTVFTIKPKFYFFNPKVNSKKQIGNANIYMLINNIKLWTKIISDICKVYIGIRRNKKQFIKVTRNLNINIFHHFIQRKLTSTDFSLYLGFIKHLQNFSES